MSVFDNNNNTEIQANGPIDAKTMLSIVTTFQDYANIIPDGGFSDFEGKRVYETWATDGVIKIDLESKEIVFFDEERQIVLEQLSLKEALMKLAEVLNGEPFAFDYEKGIIGKISLAGDVKLFDEANGITMKVDFGNMMLLSFEEGSTIPIEEREIFIPDVAKIV